MTMQSVPALFGLIRHRLTAIPPFVIVAVWHWWAAIIVAAAMLAANKAAQG